MAQSQMRILHRYLGFFLVGIMSVYALSGIVLIFRDTSFLKKEVNIERELKSNIPSEELGKALGKRELKIFKEEGSVIFFEHGEYNKLTGVAKYSSKELPYLLNQMTKLHKAKSSQPLFWLNVFFGLSLLFFAVSSFWMFLPKNQIFKKGMYFTLAGIVLTLLMLFL